MANTKQGERRLQILQMLAEMLEHPAGEKITTAALAARLSVSEAALYRHFASKAQMFEGLIDFIESTVFGLINRITDQEEDAPNQVRAITLMLLNFAERNPGMTRVLNGDALVNEHERLQARMNQFLERVELALRNSLRLGVMQGKFRDSEVAARARLIVDVVAGRWQRYAKTGFRQMPSAGGTEMIELLLGGDTDLCNRNDRFFA